MPWTRRTSEKAWRIFDKALPVIAEALDVTVDELRSFYLQGESPDILPPATMEAPGVTMEPSSHGNAPVWYDESPPSLTPEQFEVIADAIAMPPDPEPKRATRADLAPVPPEVVLEQAAPLLEKPVNFTSKAPKKLPNFVTGPLYSERGNAPPGVDVQMGAEPQQKQGSRTSQHPFVPPRPKPKAGPAEFFLMHEGRYLHESCTGLTDDRKRAWRQPESKIAAVRRKFPETVDYTEVPAS